MLLSEIVIAQKISYSDKSDIRYMVNELKCNTKDQVISRFGIPDKQMTTNRNGKKYLSVYEYIQGNNSELVKMTFYFSESDDPKHFNHKNYQRVARIRIMLMTTTDSYIYEKDGDQCH